MIRLSSRGQYSEVEKRVFNAFQTFSKRDPNAVMSQQTKELFEFGQFTLDAHERRLLRNGQPVSLKPKVIETLLLLIENSGRTTYKE